MSFRVYAFFFVTFLSAIGLAGQQPVDKSIDPPRLVAPLNPDYPQHVKDASIGGRVTVRVTVSETGDATSIDQPAGPARLCNGSEDDPRLAILRDSTIAAVRKAKFTPAMKDGKPVRMTIWVSATFDPLAPDSPATEKNLIQDNVVKRGYAKRLSKPPYPLKARGERASGAVPVRIVVDEEGRVFTAQAIAGHHLLRDAAVEAACSSEFTQTKLNGKAVRVTGVITYNFAP